MNYRQLLAAILSTLLVALPSLSAPQAVAVAGASKATVVHGEGVAQGMNIMNGDVVEVAQNGDTILLMGHNSTVHVPSDSAVRIFRCGDRSVVQLLRGQLTFRATPQRPVQVQLGDALTQPTAGQLVVGTVALTSPTTANLTAQQGSFTVSTAHEGRSLLLNQGETKQVTLASAADVANPNPPICGVAAYVPTSAATAAWVMLGLGAAGLAALAATKTQPTLTCDQKGALVSPYQFPCP